MKHKLNLKLFICISIISLFIAGCSSDGPEIEQPEKIYYDQAQRRMANKNYVGAIESLEAIETRYPFGKYAEQAQIELIYAFFMNDQQGYPGFAKFFQHSSDDELKCFVFKKSSNNCGSS